MDKPDLLIAITKKICETCSPREDSYQATNDYTLSEIYKDKDYERLDNGELKRDKNGKLITKKSDKSKKYYYSLNAMNKKYVTDWGRYVSEKTKKYF